MAHDPASSTKTQKITLHKPLSESKDKLSPNLVSLCTFHDLQHQASFPFTSASGSSRWQTLIPAQIYGPCPNNENHDDRSERAYHHSVFS